MTEQKQSEEYTHNDFLLAIEPQVKELLAAMIEGRKPLDLDAIVASVAPATLRMIEPVLFQKTERRMLSLLVSVGVVPPDALAEYDKDNAPKAPTGELDLGSRAMGDIDFAPIG